MALGETVAGMRKLRKWTQRELAERVHVDVSAVSRWERGEAMPNTEQLRLLCIALKCSADHLLELPQRRARSA